MSRRRLILTPRADREVLDAHDWYEGQRKGPGKEFRAVLRDAMRPIRARPTGRPVYADQVRRLRRDRFPYWVYYLVSDDLITIVTVFHASRDPDDLDRALTDPLPDPEEPS
jgi:plasmid stabilization system protein ParE